MALPPPFPESEDVTYAQVGEPIDMARHHRARTKDRKQALDVLFEADLRGRTLGEALVAHEKETGVQIRPYAALIVNGVSENLEQINRTISNALGNGWDLPRMPRVDRCLAQLAVWEIISEQVPTSVAISEAVELAQELSTAESANFINGVLRTVVETAN